MVTGDVTALPGRGRCWLLQPRPGPAAARSGSWHGVRVPRHELLSCAGAGKRAGAPPFRCCN